MNDLPKASPWIPCRETKQPCITSGVTPLGTRRVSGASARRWPYCSSASPRAAAGFTSPMGRRSSRPYRRPKRGRAPAREGRCSPICRAGHTNHPGPAPSHQTPRARRTEGRDAPGRCRTRRDEGVAAWAEPPPAMVEPQAPGRPVDGPKPKRGRGVRQQGERSARSSGMTNAVPHGAITVTCTPPAVARRATAARNLRGLPWYERTGTAAAPRHAARTRARRSTASWAGTANPPPRACAHGDRRRTSCDWP